VEILTLVLGGLLTIGGAGGLVVAFRRGQAQDRAGESRWFRAAVVALALGSAAFLVTVTLSR
jgi:hypothetical protein